MTDGPYDAWVLDHSKSPRNQGPLPQSTHQARVDNPLCGDRITVAVILDGQVVVTAQFEGRACAICVAAASHMTTLVQGRTLEEVQHLRSEVDRATDPHAESALDPLRPLTAVRRFPARRRCATLPWEALGQALDGQGT